MTEGNYLIKRLAEEEGLSLSDKQAEEIYSYMIEYSLEFTMKTILEVIIILWLAS